MTGLWEIAGKVAIAAVLAGAVGAEREWTGKWAGLRTHMLIAVGAVLLTDLSIALGPRFAGGSASWDPGRIAAQIVSGVGFLGAGTIIQARGTVHGLTTAAGLWVAAAIGMAVGAGFYTQAVVATLAILAILVALRPVERRLLAPQGRTIRIEVAGGRRFEEILEVLETAGVQSGEVRLERYAGGVVVRIGGASRATRRHLLELALERGMTARESDG